MSTLTPRPLLPTFLPSLNALLATLGLPFNIDHPTDLTPSLLLAIFESLICARLPIPASVRQSRTRDAKTRAMLVLLGVLECDVLRGGTANDAEHSIASSNADDSVLGDNGGVSVDGWVDEIGLGEVDPERLADGGWEETIFVGELLCWLARRKGILPRTRSLHWTSHSRSLYSNYHSYGTEGEGDTADFSTSLLLRPSPTPKSWSPRPPSPSPSIHDINVNADSSALSHITDVPRHPLVHSPEPSLSASVTTGTDLSIRARSVSSRTSVSVAHDDPDEFEEVSQDTLQLYDPRRMMQDAEEDGDRPPIFRPQCIHELDDPSYIHALAGPSLSFDPSASHERVSEDEEDLPSYEDDEADVQDHDNPYAPPTPTPRRVRLTGWIEPVDHATEFSHFSASRSRAFCTTTSSGLGPPTQSRSQSQSHKHVRIGELPRSTSRPITDLSPHPLPGSSKPRTPHRVPPPSPSPSPSPSPPPISSKHPPVRSPPSPPPSPPSPPAHSDPPFDVSFSTPNNTSTPAKPRLPRRPQIRTNTRHAAASDALAGGGKTRAGLDARTGTGTGRPHRRERSPSYTPSPPSFTTPGSLRSAGVTQGTRFGPTGGSSATPPSAMVMGRKRTPSTDAHAKDKSPPPGSTATTNTLLTERARLLTELAALKRARAMSGASIGMGTGTGGGGVGRRVGIGV